jgi:DNA repair and recombination protein RAD54B
LRDIFRIHPDTACNTHDLLECPCYGSGFDQDHASDILDNDAEDVELEQGFVAASRVKPEHTNAGVSILFIIHDHKRPNFMPNQYLKKKKAQLAALGEWTHINGLHPSARDNVKDDILRKLLYSKEETAERPVVEHRSRLDALLTAVDLENIGADATSLAACDVPGGTVSFLFERCSKVILEETDIEVVTA